MELKPAFLTALAAVSVIFLVSLFFRRGILQSLLKGCLIPLILAIYIFGSEKIIIPVILALLFGWAGDLFLLKISNLRRFRLGLASFLTGHVCYILAFSFFIRPFSPFVLLTSAAAASVLGVCMFKLVRPIGEMKYPVIVYEIIILLMAVSAVQVFFARGGAFGVFSLTGSVLFVVSDGTLAYDTFRKKTRYGFLLVMVTYILAQLFIALGFCAA